MDYNNPLSPWNQIHHDKMYDDMTDDEKMKAGCLHLFVVIVMAFVGLGLCCLFGSCTTTKYVTVPEYHTTHYTRTMCNMTAFMCVIRSISTNTQKATPYIRRRRAG